MGTTITEAIEEILSEVIQYSGLKIDDMADYLRKENSKGENIKGESIEEEILYQMIASASNRFFQKSSSIAKDMVHKKPYYFLQLANNATEYRVLEGVYEKGLLYPSVDLLHVGSGEIEVSGIMVTFSASIAVIQKAIQHNCNFIITHEPTFYCHTDHQESIVQLEQSKQKRKLLEDNQIAVWRFHDLCHMLKRDFIVEGVLKKTGYDPYVKNKNAIIPIIECETTVNDIINRFKNTMNAKGVRLLGDLSMQVKRFCICVGKPDSASIMKCMETENIDFVIVGEINEWEMGDYVKDAIALGKPKGLLVIGHQPSEMVGMELFTDWLTQKLPDQRILYAPTEDLFQSI